MWGVIQTENMGYRESSLWLFRLGSSVVHGGQAQQSVRRSECVARYRSEERARGRKAQWIYGHDGALTGSCLARQTESIRPVACARELPS